MHLEADQPSNGIIVLFSAFAATVSAVWGYDTIACKGIVTGAISAVMRTGFLVFVHAWTLVECVALFAVFLGIAYCLTRRPALQKRQELLAFALPVAAFLGGIVAAVSSSVGLKCALHPWA